MEILSYSYHLLALGRSGYVPPDYRIGLAGTKKLDFFVYIVQEEVFGNCGSPTNYYHMLRWRHEGKNRAKSEHISFNDELHI
jgi:hypothetical protein